MLSRKQKGFTLIELLIVVAIIGILAAIAIPNLLTAMQRSRQRRTMADMRSIATAWEARAVDLNQYNAAGAYTLPGTALTSATLEFYLAPTYIRNFATGDGWRKAWGYFADQNFTDPNSTNAKAQRYAIRSLSKDGVAQSSYEAGPTTDFNCDIIYENGNFIVFPEGVQQGN